MDVSVAYYFLASLFAFILAFFLYDFIKKRFINDEEEVKEDNLPEVIATNVANTLLNDEASPINKLIKKQGEKFEQFLTTTGAINESMEGLAKRTDKLHDILYNPIERGTWGELLADRVLNVLEFKKGVDYETKKVMKSGGEPDYTFYLPEGQIVNMDAKFPLTGYEELSRITSDLGEETDETRRERLKSEYEVKTKDFTSSVRTMIRDEVGGKGYISPEENTVGFALMYIPVEAVYSFLIEQKISSKDKVTNKNVEESVIDFSLRHKVIIVNPSMLMAYLQTIRMAVNTFTIQNNVKNIIDIHQEFKQEWESYKSQYDKVDTAIGKVKLEFENLSGTRDKALDRVVNKMDALGMDLEVEE